MRRNSFSEPFPSIFDMEPYLEQRKTNKYMDEIIKEYKKEKVAREKAEKSAKIWQWISLGVTLLLALLEGLPKVISLLQSLGN